MGHSITYGNRENNEDYVLPRDEAALQLQLKDNLAKKQVVTIATVDQTIYHNVLITYVGREHLIFTNPPAEHSYRYSNIRSIIAGEGPKLTIG